MRTKEERELALLEALLAEDDAGATEVCPGPAVLMSLADGQHSDARDAEVRAHVAACPSCTDLMARLRNFDEGVQGQAAAAAKQEWAKAEPRMDHWMTNYLSLQQRNVRTREKKSEAGLGTVFSRFARVRWGIAIAAGACAAALVVGVIESRKASISPAMETGSLVPAPASSRGGGIGAGSGIGKDSTVLTSNGQEGAASSAEAPPLKFVSDEVVTAKLIAVAGLANGRSRVSEIILSSTVGQDSLTGIKLSGVLDTSDADHGVLFAVNHVERNDIPYLPSPVSGAEDERPFVLTVLGGESGWRVGDTVQMKVLRDQVYVVTGL